MKYNDIYSKNKSVWGNAPNKLLQKIELIINQTGNFLDLGCGQGRDLIFMIKKGWNVVGVDNSTVAIENIEKNLSDFDKIVNKVKLFNKDVVDYNIKKNYFDIINCCNTLQFLSKLDAVELLKKMKLGLVSGGYILISGFTDLDPSFQEGKGFFTKNEIKQYCKDFEIVFYKESEIDDKGHPGFKKPHKHFIYQLIAKKP